MYCHRINKFNLNHVDIYMFTYMYQILLEKLIRYKGPTGLC